MLKLQLLCVGKLKEKWMQQGIAEYRKRLSRFADVEIIEVPDQSDDLPLERILSIEGDALLKRLPERGVRVLLDLGGKMPDSLDFAQGLRQWMDRSGGMLTFVIGGSNGLDDRVRQACDVRWSLSPLTFPHTLTRVLVLEQLFRGFKLDAGESYHK